MMSRSWEFWRHRIGGYADAAAENWMGFAFPPARQAIEEAEWSPDDFVSYCPRCGDSVADGEATDTGCATCRPKAELAGGIGDGLVRLGSYLDELQSWVQAIKFGRWVEMGEELGSRLGSQMCHSGLVDVSQTIVVPMPMPWMRRMYRGIDHSRVIANAAARELGVPIVPILSRGNHRPQVSLAASERKRRGSHGLRVRPRWVWDNWVQIVASARNQPRGRGTGPLRGVHVVLVDDVRTTGATLKAAVRLLRSLKPERVVAAVVAVSDAKARHARREQSEGQRVQSQP